MAAHEDPKKAWADLDAKFGNRLKGEPKQTVLEMALAYRAAGISVVPVKRGGSKAPAVDAWKQYQTRIATEATVRRWWGVKDPPGIGGLSGRVSNNKETLDFDREAEKNFPLWRELVEAERPGLLARLCIVRSPRQPEGWHAHYRVEAGYEIPGNTSLAEMGAHEEADGKRRGLIETRGEGGYAVLPGSPPECHRTGGIYQHVSGPPLTDLSVITAEERETLIRLAKLFDRRTGEDKKKPEAARPGDRVGDDYDLRGPDWAELLEKDGWALERQAGEVRYWTRPGKDHGVSATTGKCRRGRDGADLLKVFTSNAPGLEMDGAYSKFRYYAIIRHHGDFRAAARELGREGYGSERAPQTAEGGSGGPSGNSPDFPDSPDGWGEVVALGGPPPAVPFPIEVLPTPVRRFVREVAAALPCPPDYVAVPLLVVAGAELGASRALEIKEGHVQRALLYAAVIAPPGSLKSPALEKAAEPVSQEDEREQSAWRERMEAHKDQLAAYERQHKQAAKEGSEAPQKPQRPALRRVVVNDTTAEALAPILQENPRGLVLIRDELVGWVASMNQYREGGKGADQQFWLSGWSSSTVVVDRKSNHDEGPLRIPHPFVAVVGTLVPEKLPLLRGDRGRQRADDDGFIDRILLAYPDPLPAEGESWEEISPAARRDYHDAMGRLRTLEMVERQEGGRTIGYRPHFVGLTEDARREWKLFTDAHAEEVNSPDFPAHLRGPWSKLRGYCGRLALIIHYLRWAAAEFESSVAPVDATDIARAVCLVTYFKAHARRVLACMGADRKTEQARKILNWIRREGCNSFARWQPFNDLRSDTDFPTPDSLDPALKILEDHNVIRATVPPLRSGAGRKPGPRYEVNPKVLNPENQENQENTNYPPADQD